MKLDELESVFRSAVKPPFHYRPPAIDSALLITDLDEAGTEAALQETRRFLSKAHSREIEWSTLSAGQFREVAEVLDRVRRNPPSLVVCYRHLLGQGAKLPYSLGSTVDTLTQATDVPVLLLPRPEDGVLRLPESTRRVVVVTDQITGDDNLVSWAAHLCAEEGTLHLTHVENQRELRRILDACAKIPGIAQDVVETKLPDKLLSMASDYIASVRDILAEHGLHEKVQAVVKLGNPVKDYERLVAELEVDLLVMNTKDEGQNAMHSLAYALSVEIRDRPLLLL